MKEADGPTDRHRRSSVHTDSSHVVINSLRQKIKSVEDEKGQRRDLIDPLKYGSVIHQEHVLIGKKTKIVRRAYMADHRYKVGWVVDWDVHRCMVCSAKFGWYVGRPKHHCRACGSLVCHNCSPYVSVIPGLDEFRGSRVCVNCFGLKPGLFGTPHGKGGTQASQIDHSRDSISVGSSEIENSTVSTKPEDPLGLLATGGVSLQQHHQQHQQHQQNQSQSPNGSVRRPRSSRKGMSVLSTGSVLSGTPAGGSVRTAASAAAGNTSTQRHSGSNKNNHSSKQIPPTVVITSSSSSTPLTMASDIDHQLYLLEQEQLPLYEHDYLKMREFVPLDIYKSNLQRLITQGLPDTLAARIWNNKALWLIVTHKEDIYKIHLADFRSKYVPDGLDVMELRAIWYNLPEWDPHSGNPLEVGKVEWKTGFKSKLDNQIYRMHSGTLPEHLKRNPAYEDCDLLHLFDAMVPLPTRYERSASQYQHTIDSPQDALRTHYGVSEESVDRRRQRPSPRANRESFQIRKLSYLNQQEQQQEQELLQEQQDEESDKNIFEYEEGDSDIDRLMGEEEENGRENDERPHSGSSYQQRQEDAYQARVLEINNARFGHQSEGGGGEDEDEDDEVSDLEDIEHEQDAEATASDGEQQHNTVVPFLNSPYATSMGTADPSTGGTGISNLACSKNDLDEEEEEEEEDNEEEEVENENRRISAAVSRSLYGSSLSGRRSFRYRLPVDLSPLPSSSSAPHATSTCTGSGTSSNNRGKHSPGVPPQHGLGVMTDPNLSPIDAASRVDISRDAPLSYGSGRSSRRSRSSDGYGGGSVGSGGYRRQYSGATITSSSRRRHHELPIGRDDSMDHINSMNTSAGDEVNGGDASSTVSPIPVTGPYFYMGGGVHRSLSPASASMTTSSTSSATATIRVSAPVVAVGTSASRISNRISHDDSRGQPDRITSSYSPIDLKSQEEAQNTSSGNNRSSNSHNDHSRQVHLGGGGDDPSLLVTPLAQSFMTANGAPTTIKTARKNLRHDIDNDDDKDPDNGREDGFNSDNGDSDDASFNTAEGDHTPLRHDELPPAAMRRYQLVEEEEEKGEKGELLRVDHSPAQQKIRKEAGGGLEPTTPETPLPSTTTTTTAVVDQTNAIGIHETQRQGNDEPIQEITASPNKEVIEEYIDNSANKVDGNDELYGAIASAEEENEEEEKEEETQGSEVATVDVINIDEARALLMQHLLLGEAQEADALMNRILHARAGNDSGNDSKHDQTLVSAATSSELLLQCFMDPQSLSEPIPCFKLLLHTFGADINYQEADTGKTTLHYLVEQDEEVLGQVFIAHGADVFLNDAESNSSLSLSLSKHSDWLLDAFRLSGQYDALIQQASTASASADEEDEDEEQQGSTSSSYKNKNQKLREGLQKLFNLATLLIYSGYSAQASAVLHTGLLQIDPADASELLRSCQGNFEHMRDPVETFELLESLGATIS